MAAGLYTEGAHRAKAARLPAQPRKTSMSRASLILLFVVLIIVGGAVYLASMNTEVATKQVEKAVVLNDAAPQ